MKVKQEKGFTLIELIIVIVILGILAVTAAPRFFDFSGDARASTVSGLAGALKGAANIEFAKNAVEGTTPLTYPLAASSGVGNIVDAAQITTSDWTITGGGTSGAITFTAKNVTTATTCQVTYSSTGSGASAAYSLTADISDCS